FWSFAHRLVPHRVPADYGSTEQVDATVEDMPLVHVDPAGRTRAEFAIVPLRDQDVVLRLDPAGAIRWMLGDPTGWGADWQDLFLRPVGTPSWPIHAHGPEWLDGRLLIFDNNGRGHTPYQPEPDGPYHSRAVEYRVDEEA